MNITLAIFVAWLAGAGMVRLLVPAPARPVANAPGAFVQRLGLALTLGLGVASGLHFFRLAFAPGLRGGPFLFELLLLILGALAALLATTLRRAAPATIAPPEPAESIAKFWCHALLLAPLAALAAMAAAWIIRGRLDPLGWWDAWAFWNTRARFLFLGGAQWVNYYDPSLGWAHPDYPMLLPLSVARCWIYADNADFLAPILLAATFAIATTAILWGTFRNTHGLSIAAIAAFAYLGMPAVLDQVPLQLADAPVGLFMLASLTLVMHALQPNRPTGLVQQFGPWIAAGLFAGCAAWTKREGSLFIVASTAGVLCTLIGPRPNWRALVAWIIGLIPMLAVLICFKLRYPVQADIRSIAFSFQSLTDLEKHRIIWTRSAATLWAEAPAWGVIVLAMLACAFTFGIDRTRARSAATRAACVTLGIMASGYYAVYLFTPYDTAWMVDYSISRLAVQLWPLAILSACWLFKTPWQTPPATPDLQPTRQSV